MVKIKEKKLLGLGAGLEKILGVKKTLEKEERKEIEEIEGKKEIKKERKKEGELSKTEVKRVQAKIDGVRREIKKIVVGQDAALNALLRAMIADGHVLIEGVPGIAKTLLMIALARVTGTEFKRIQFTPDMLPSDITGMRAYYPEKGFVTVKGPIFTNLVLADEINRAPAKVQSAMLEAMQERKVTIAGETHEMKRPFLVLATQNTIETLGVYALPAAQVDRFLFKLVMTHPLIDEEKQVLKKNISIYSIEDYGLKQVLQPREILKLQNLVHKVYVSEEVEDYIVSLTDATRKPKEYGISLGRFIQYGASPRASIGLYIGAKAQAMMDGSTFVTPKHVKEVAFDVFRHRILLNYEGQAEDIKIDSITKEVLEKTPVY